MLNQEETTKRFRDEMPLILQLEFNNSEYEEPLKRLEAEYNLPMQHIAELVIIHELPLDQLEKGLESGFKLDPVRAARLAALLREQVFSPLLERLGFMNMDEDKPMGLEQQKAIAEKLFRSGLLAELGHNPIIIEAVNRALFYVLARDDSFHERLERALYENTERLSNASISLNGQPAAPTIGNWLRDYISQYGAQNDSVSQSIYITNSPNAKVLTAEEREVLVQIIKIYTNVKFFPESMPTDNGEGWAIIPGGETDGIYDDEDEEEDITALDDGYGNAENDTEVGDKRQEAIDPYAGIAAPVALRGFNEQRREDVAPEAFPVSRPTVPSPAAVRSENARPANPRPRLAVSKPIAPIAKPIAPIAKPAATVAKVIEDSEELMNLKNMLLQYPAGSLERKAIEDEIKKLS